MSFYHVTTAAALRGIRKDGFLDPLRSRGKREYTWFVPAYRVELALLHVQVRHGVPLSEVVVMEFELDGHWFSEHAASCKYFRKERTYLKHCTRVKTATQWVSRDEDDWSYQEWGPEVHVK